MEIDIENFCKIQSAKIEIGGLSVIVGKNDSGKSTVGKCLYALEKSIGEYKTLYDNTFNNDLRQKIDRILRRLRYFQRDSNDDIYDTIEKQLEIIDKSIIEKDNNDKSNDMIFIKQQREQIEQLLENRSESNNFKLKETMNRIVFPQVFIGMKLNNILNKQDKTTIKFLYHKQNVISLNITNNNIDIDEQNSNETLYDFGIDKVILIDTPLLLEQNSSLYNIMYRNDIVQLLFKNNDKVTLFDNNRALLDKFKNIISGEFYIENISNRYLYRINDNTEGLEVENIAMGMKTIGILYLLLKNESISHNSLIILDEPENHLHPSWIIKFADILCYMVSIGFRILLTTHNPDFVQMLSHYSKQYQLQNMTNFYLCKENSDVNDNYTIIENKTDDIDKIYQNLVGDTNEIFFQSMKEDVFGKNPYFSKD